MAKNVEHVSHIKSKLKTNGLPQLPSPDKLVDGEIAINYAEGVETISIRNENSAITTFSSDNYYTEKKLGSGFTNNDATVTEAIDDLEYMIVNKEEAIAAALNDLNGRKLDASAYTPTDLSNYYTKDETSGKTEISNALGGKVNTATFTGHTADTTIHITSAERTAWNAKADISDIPSVNGYADSVQYNSATKNVEFYHGTTAGTKVFEYDASPFLIDGMVQNVEIKDVQSGDPAVTVTCLVVSFNTDAGKQDINIPISQIFDANNYYTTSQTSGATEIQTAFNAIDDLVGSGFTSSSITDVIIENERIVSEALNDLDDRKLDASAYTPTDLSNYYTKSQTSGATEISTALSGKLDASEYATFSAETNTSIEDLSGQSETIAAALNDLDDRKLDASAYTPTDLTNYYTKSQTSGATELQTAFGNKANTATTLAGYGITDAYTKSETSGATELQTAFNGKVNTSDIISAITPSNSGSTAPISTKVVAENELTVLNALNDLNAAITPLAAHTADTSIHVTQALLDRIAYLENKVIYNGHQYVDLGLRSGTKWATMNVGASSETDYGNYYQYGKGAAQYAATSGDSIYSGTEQPLAASADTAVQVWGGSWHMPTRVQMQELTDNTTYKWVTNYKGSGINGGTFTATNGNYVFIPAAGRWGDGSQNDVGNLGSYWSSSPSGSDYACDLFFSYGSKDAGDSNREYGYSVRPVVG